MLAASSPAGELISGVASLPASTSPRICPPAEATSALIQTMYPSYRLACTPMTLCWPSAALIISSQVKSGEAGSTPAARATDLRYQSSCVFAQNGAATSWLFQEVVSSGASRTPSVNVGTSALANGRRKPALANSAMNGGSRLITSIELSWAARRRTSCSRCDDASFGSTWISTLYAPFDACAHRSASRPWPPLSGLMYQFRVGVPVSSLLHAVSSDPTRTRGARHAIRRRRWSRRRRRSRLFWSAPAHATTRLFAHATIWLHR